MRPRELRLVGVTVTARSLWLFASTTFHNGWLYELLATASQTQRLGRMGQLLFVGHPPSVAFATTHLFRLRYRRPRIVCLCELEQTTKERKTEAGAGIRSCLYPIACFKQVVSDGFLIFKTLSNRVSCWFGRKGRLTSVVVRLWCSCRHSFHCPPLVDSLCRSDLACCLAFWTTGA